VKFARPHREEVSVNLAPLIDVVFLLLIFFMVTTTFTKETRLTLELPTADGQSVTDQVPEFLEITISQDAQYAINGQVLVSSDIDSVKEALRRLSKGSTDIPLVITADANAPHQAVVTALDASGQLGFSRLNITTKRPSE
jgi:biopolymer transport protein ExbD